MGIRVALFIHQESCQGLFNKLAKHRIWRFMVSQATSQSGLYVQ